MNYSSMGMEADVMNIHEALEYTRANWQKLKESGEAVLGLCYAPLDQGGEFQLFEVTYEEPDDEDDCPYAVHTQTGRLFSSINEEETFTGDEPSEVLEDLPAVAMKLNYRVFKVGETLADLAPEGWLMRLFPDLPDPDDLETNRNEFRRLAIERIALIGNAFDSEQFLN